MYRVRPMTTMSSSNKQMPVLPGFVWDADRQRYFRIPPSHAHASLASAAVPTSVLTAAAAPKTRHKHKSPHGHGTRNDGSNESHKHKRKKQRTREASPTPQPDGRHPPTLCQLLRLRQCASPTVDQILAVSATHRSTIRSTCIAGRAFESIALMSAGSWQLGLAEPSIVHVPIHSGLGPDGYCLGSGRGGSGVLISTLSDGSLSSRTASAHGSHNSLHISSTTGRGIPNSLHYSPTSHSLLLSTLPSHTSPTALLQYLPLPATFPSLSSADPITHTLPHFPTPTFLQCPRDRTIHATHSSPTLLAVGGSKCVLIWDANTLQPLTASRHSPSTASPIPLRSDAFAVQCTTHPNVLLAGQRDGWLSVIDLRTPSSRPATSHPPPAAIASKPKHTYDHRPTHLPTWPISSILADVRGSTYCVFRGGHVAEYIPGYGQHMVHVADEALDGEHGFDVAMRQCAAGVDPVGGGVVCARPARKVGGWVYVLGGKKVAEVERMADEAVASALVVVESEATGRPVVVSVSASS